MPHKKKNKTKGSGGEREVKNYTFAIFNFGPFPKVWINIIVCARNIWLYFLFSDLTDSIPPATAPGDSHENGHDGHGGPDRRCLAMVTMREVEHHLGNHSSCGGQGQS